MEMIMRDKPLHIASCQHGVDYGFGHPWIDVPGDDFHVFFNDFIGDTQRIITAQESLPYFVIMAPRRYGHNKAVGVKYDVLHGSFVRGTLMQMTETLHLRLIQCAVFPQAVYLFLHLLGKIVGYDLPQFRQHHRGLDERHHVQQFQLCLIKYGLHNRQCFIFDMQKYAFSSNPQPQSLKDYQGITRKGENANAFPPFPVFSGFGLLLLQHRQSVRPERPLVVVAAEGGVHAVDGGLPRFAVIYLRSICRCA